VIDLALGMALSVFLAPPEPPVELIPPVSISAPPRPTMAPMLRPCADAVVIVREGATSHPCDIRGGMMVTVLLKWRPTLNEQINRCDDIGGITHEHPNGLDVYCVDTDF
jgi:hypothetical protein